MKKILAILMSASLVLLSACSSEPSSSQEPESSQPQSSSSEAAEPEESGSEAENTAIDPDVQKMMDALTSYEPGTAGSSLKACIAACGVLNYAEGYDESQEQTLRTSIENYLAQADADTLARLQEGRDDVELAAAEILTGSEESKALLSDAGNPNEYDSYHSEKYEAVILVLQDVLDSANTTPDSAQAE